MYYTTLGLYASNGKRKNENMANVLSLQKSQNTFEDAFCKKIQQCKLGNV